MQERRAALERVLHEVVDKRFMYYGFKLFALSLHGDQYAIEIHRAHPSAPAMGTTSDLADILERYLLAAQFRIAEVIAARLEVLALVVS